MANNLSTPSEQSTDESVLNLLQKAELRSLLMQAFSMVLPIICVISYCTESFTWSCRRKYFFENCQGHAASTLKNKNF